MQSTYHDADEYFCIFKKEDSSILYWNQTRKNGIGFGTSVHFSDGEVVRFLSTDEALAFFIDVYPEKEVEDYEVWRVQPKLAVTGKKPLDIVKEHFVNSRITRIFLADTRVEDTE